MGFQCWRFQKLFFFKKITIRVSKTIKKGVKGGESPPAVNKHPLIQEYFQIGKYVPVVIIFGKNEKSKMPTEKDKRQKKVKRREKKARTRERESKKEKGQRFLRTLTVNLRRISWEEEEERRRSKNSEMDEIPFPFFFSFLTFFSLVFFSSSSCSII